MEEEWLCREMDRLFGADPDWHSGCVGPGRTSAARACVESAGGRGAGGTLSGVPGPVYGSGQTGTCPTPVPQAHVHRRHRYQSQTDAIQTETDRELTSPLQLGRSRDDRPAAECQRPGKQTCAFCRKNGESKEVVTSHSLRDSSGRVLCPILRSHVCELCQLTGDHAHTRTYCPLAADAGGGGRGRPAPSTTVQLKSTRNNATGRRRH